jgi:hypothetical protein
MREFMEFWYPSIRTILWLGFLVYLVSLLKVTFLAARKRRDLRKLEESKNE